MKRKNQILLSSLLLISGVTLSLGVGVTYAGYKATKRVNQTIGYKGKLDQASIFFNANIWEVDNAIFFIYNNSTSKWISPTKTISPVIGGTTFKLHVFVLDNPGGTSNITFVRVNPNGANVPANGTSGFAVATYFTAEPKTVWNQTDNFTYSSSYNYYCIPSNGWTSGTYYHNTNEKNSGCVKNNLTAANDGTLSFDGSDSGVSPIS